MVGGALAAGAIAWLGLPLWRGDEPAGPPDPRAVGLLANREALLAAIRDLDADAALGRLNSDEHDLRRRELVERGAQVLMALDQLQAETGGETARRAAVIEAEVAARAVARSGTIDPEIPVTAAGSAGAVDRTPTGLPVTRGNEPPGHDAQ